MTDARQIEIVLSLAEKGGRAPKYPGTAPLVAVAYETLTGIKIMPGKSTSPTPSLPLRARTDTDPQDSA
ncbi:hypothetical protein B7P34_25570 [Streptosporangium nondiastaticum]|uniref:Uncharacterized protein n=1 Tax=Streptosporangium nondiastaticum TaxID=35764 RepID=A0A9X7JLN3_9ACTN|nr:hypothetical protein [Streptosporangium nondiastaticum]PSJ25922.1 hypothetical protein B7P34_25570 [Streptosporangium nondiastaticum]